MRELILFTRCQNADMILSPKTKARSRAGKIGHATTTERLTRRVAPSEGLWKIGLRATSVRFKSRTENQIGRRGVCGDDQKEGWRGRGRRWWWRGETDTDATSPCEPLPRPPPPPVSRSGSLGTFGAQPFDRTNVRSCIPTERDDRSVSRLVFDSRHVI
jgi:hypothetical protein